MNITASMALAHAPGKTFKELTKYFQGIEPATIRKIVDFLCKAGQLELLPSDRYALVKNKGRVVVKKVDGKVVPVDEKIPSIDKILSEYPIEDEHAVSLHTSSPEPAAPKKKKVEMRPLVIPERPALHVEVTDGAKFYGGFPYLVSIAQGSDDEEESVLLNPEQWQEICEYVEKMKDQFTA